MFSLETERRLSKPSILPFSHSFLLFSSPPLLVSQKPSLSPLAKRLGSGLATTWVTWASQRLRRSSGPGGTALVKGCWKSCNEIPQKLWDIMKHQLETSWNIMKHHMFSYVVIFILPANLAEDELILSLQFRCKDMFNLARWWASCTRCTRGAKMVSLLLIERFLQSFCYRFMILKWF